MHKCGVSLTDMAALNSHVEREGGRERKGERGREKGRERKGGRVREDGSDRKGFVLFSNGLGRQLYSRVGANLEPFHVTKHC